MNIRTTAALVAALIAVAGCTEDQQKSGDAFLSLMGVSGVQPPDYSAGSQQVAEIIEVETLRQIDGVGSMGEEIWTGPGCSNVFRVRICQ